MPKSTEERIIDLPYNPNARRSGSSSSGGGSASSFLALSDTPSSYADAGGHLVKVRATEDGLEFAPGSGGSVDSVNGQTGTVVLDADDIDDTSTTNKFATASELSKLAGIEANADVTDAGNVGAAIDSASTDDTIDDTDTLGYTTGTTLKKSAWSNIKSKLTALFDTLYAPIAKGVTNGDSHDHSGGDGAQIDHGGLGGLGDDDHTQYHNNTRGDARYAQLAAANTFTQSQDISGGTISADNFQRYFLSINDDAAGSVALRGTNPVNFLLLKSNNIGGSYYDAWIFLRAGATPFTILRAGHASVVVTTGALSGTTGADGKLTISTHTDGRLYVENRLGNSGGFTMAVL